LEGPDLNNNYFQKALSDRCAVVVHFSHHAKMGHEISFPDDLNHAIKAVQEIRSCCVLWPGHSLNLPGSVGVIFSPRVEHVLSVCSSDSGSYESSDGEDFSAGVPLSESSLRETFNVPSGSYNEWRIRGAPLLGIFVADQHRIIVKQPTTLKINDEQINDIYCTQIDLEMVFESFPSRKVYTLGTDGLVELDGPERP
jgi:hypothetical protein